MPNPDVQAARTYLAEVLAGRANLSPLVQAVRAVYGDAYRVGIFAAAQQTGSSVMSTTAGESVPSTDAEWRRYWDSWKPGDDATAELLDRGGLRRLLDQAEITIKGIQASGIDRMGTILAEGAAKGLGSETIARQLREVVLDPDRARVIARTELARAVSAAEMDGYTSAGVTQWEWLVSPGACPICEDNAAGSPYPVGSGPVQPAHPNCVCSYAPITPSA